MPTSQSRDQADERRDKLTTVTDQNSLPDNIDILEWLSMFFGVIFLPPAVIIISFLRPVMLESPRCRKHLSRPNEPAVDKCFVCRLFVFVITLKHVFTAYADLAVVGNFDFYPWYGRADDIESAWRLNVWPQSSDCP